MYQGALLIFLTALVVLLGAAWLTGRTERTPPGRPDGPPALPGGLPVAGCLQFEPVASYGPFPVDTGPLIIMSESMAAQAAIEREVREMIEAAERKIGPVQLTGP